MRARSNERKSDDNVNGNVGSAFEARGEVGPLKILFHGTGLEPEIQKIALEEKEANVQNFDDEYNLVGFVVNIQLL